MKQYDAPIVVVGGSLGGTIAAWSAARCGGGRKVLLLEATDWIGGQLTSQAVPPDEHRWIGEQGCTASYREYRRRVRSYYRSLPGFAPGIKIPRSATSRTRPASRCASCAKCWLRMRSRGR